MSFRKRNTVISTSPAAHSPVATTAATPSDALPLGVRPSPLDGRLTTSSGTASLDALLAGHAGLPLGSSVLIEEQGTTDFSGVLLRYYAAEGLVQGHQVHTLGFSDAWKHELPGLATTAKPGSSASSPAKSEPGASSPAPASAAKEERMKIAWRYEALGNDRNPAMERERERGSATAVFCQSFDLGKRLAPSAAKGQFYALPASSGPLSFSVDSQSPLRSFVKHLQAKLSASPPSSVHRVVVPSLLSPTLFSGTSCDPVEVLQFLHSLRALLRLHSRQLTALLTLPTSLFPRRTGLTRWMELLCDGVIELVPMPSTLEPAGPSPSGSTSNAASRGSRESQEAEKMQGMVKVHTLPVYHEKGGGGAEGNHFRDNLSFSLSSSRGLVITPYSLPPLLDDDEHKEKSPASTVKDGIDF